VEKLKPRAAAQGGPPSIPVSWGELIDKITILEIKAERIKGRTARANVKRELDALNAVVAAHAPRRGGLASLKKKLRKINLALWEIEDEIRVKEREQAFGARFVALARSVYRTNDRRGAVKREINDRLGSILVEEKHYARY
jgi:hypothetical protein